jgi:2-keto-4-pentenoate hydratase/2-oxohepta-3-ene-1,7-dioic acid hydratase in catechol pathway
MRIASIRTAEGEEAAVYSDETFFRVSELNLRMGTDWPEQVFSLVESGRLSEMGEWVGSLKGELDAVEGMKAEEVSFAPLYRRPRKIWGIGLNYREHAGDLDESAPTSEPASFMKPDTTIIGHGDTIEVPVISEKTTAEAELGIVIGRECRFVDEGNWEESVAGYTMIIDMTAEDILRRNPRNLTQSKSFDTFFSLGYLLVTPDEIDDVLKLKVATMINGDVHAENVVSNMTFKPAFLVTYHSTIMTLLPGDVISTGTPGAVHINDGDEVACRIDGFPLLVNGVKDLKN